MPKKVKVLAVILVLLGLVVVFFPPNPFETENPKRSRTRSDIVQLVVAVRSYYNEYKKYPTASDVVTEAQNAELVQVLTGLNPKKIAFLELRSGNRGVFTDPWGNYYRLRIATEGNGDVPNPYEDGPDRLNTSVIVWSVGKDGEQGQRENPKRLRGSDDITSWQ